METSTFDELNRVKLVQKHFHHARDFVQGIAQTFILIQREKIGIGTIALEQQLTLIALY